MIIEEKLLTESNYLLTKIKEVTKTALKNGSLQLIQTEYEQVNCQNIPFLVRIINNLAKKDQETKKKTEQKKDHNFNPFLPYDQNLFVSNISQTHLCVLNKFNVVDHHLLIITKEFEDQETLINPQDFEALSACLNQIDGLAFYNSGKIAGASVKHKHLQLVPFPLSPFTNTIPLEKVLGNLDNQEQFFQLSQFSFRHYFAKIDNLDQLKEIYLELLNKLDIKINQNKPDQAYNLLLTRQWMLIVPRIEESYQNISINSLGFAGLLLVRNHQQLDLLKQEEPINILTHIADQF